MKMQIFIKQIIITLLFLSFSTSQVVFAEEKQPIVPMVHWPPMKIVDKGLFKGIDVMILRELEKGLKIKFKIVESPWIRGLEDLKNGDADIITSIAKRPDREKYLYFIEPPYKNKITIVFYIHKDSGLLIRKYEDLYKKKIGMIRGGAYFERFDRDPEIDKKEVTWDSQLLEMLEARRIDVIIGEVNNLDYIVIAKGFQGKFQKSPFRFHIDASVYIAVSKKSQFLAIIPQLTALIKKMVETNKIKKIESQFFDELKIHSP